MKIHSLTLTDSALFPMTVSTCDIESCDKPYVTLVMVDDTEIQVCEDHRWV